MKTQTLIISLFTIAVTFTKAQVGINTPTPQATLDITAKNGTAPDGLLVPRVDRLRAQNMSGVQNSTLIFVNSVSNGTQSGQAINIDATGYYYFNTPTSAWVKLNPTIAPQASVNIYNSNGTLNSTRTVDQGGFSLAFTNTNLTNAFSVDGNTFSVDALNNRIGIGTAAPASNTHIINNGAATGIGTGVSTNTALILENPTAGRSILAAMKASNATTGAKEVWFGINPTYNNNNGVFNITRTAGGQDFSLDLSSGNIGINTSIPTAKLHIVGPGQYTAFQMQDGSEGANKVLVSDATGRATWVNSSSVTPAVLGTLNTTNKTVSNNLLIGSSLTLSPGRWLVYVGQLINSSVAATTSNNLWMRITLSSSSSSISTSNFSFLGSSLVSGWLSPSISNLGGFSFISGVIPVQINSSTTLYTWFSNNSPAGTPPSAAVGNNGENYFFAVPMN